MDRILNFRTCYLKKKQWRFENDLAGWGVRNAMRLEHDKAIKLMSAS